MEETKNDKYFGILKKDTEKILDVASKIIMPVLLLVLGTWFNYMTNSNSEQQRALEEKQAAAQQKSQLIESYIKHLTSTNPDERKLALSIISLDSEHFDVSLVNLVSAYASVASSPSERVAALQALSHASHYNNDAKVQAAANRNIGEIPAIPVSQADAPQVQQQATIVNQALQQAKVNPNAANKVNDLGKALQDLHLLK